MSSKSKGSLVLAMLLFLGSAPSWAAPFEGRPLSASADSSFSEVITSALSHWLGSLWDTGRSAATSIWGEYGIAIDPNDVPLQPSHDASANPSAPTVH